MPNASHKAEVSSANSPKVITMWSWTKRCLKVVPKLWHFVWSFCLKNPIDMSEEVMRITFGHLPSGDEDGSED